MTITVFGASGHVGKHVIEQALALGYTVRAFGRNIEGLLDKDLNIEKLHAIKGYIFDQNDVFKAVKDTDAVISVLGGAFDGTDKTRSLGMKNIIAQMQKAGVRRIVALGGMGVLNGDSDEYLMDMPDYPEEYKPVGREHLQAFLFLQSSGLDWTFVCAPDILNEPGTGNYHTSVDYLPQPNLAQIAADDLALFMLQETTGNKFIRHRVGISRD